MNYNFTDEVRKVLALAREEAVRLAHDHVGTEHLLLALVRGSDTALEVLESLHVERGAVRERIAQLVRPGKSMIRLGELPYTSTAKKVLEGTMAEAREMGHDYVGAEHLLLGALGQEKGIAAHVLNSLGVTVARARAVVLEREVGGPTEAKFRIEVDDTSDVSIYEQIVARVQEAVATGELKAGARLPPVRRLADQLDIAPGTVARAYGELERLGVVVTEGARGTRVAERNTEPGPKSAGADTLAGLLRPVAVAAFHMGAGAQDLRSALEEAMRGIFES
jgi:DNA-binding transcriptional regulator YhcF (GntR family)